MKSRVRLGATLGLIGSAVIGSSFIGSVRVLALPQEQVVQKLGAVPVFTITDNKGAPLVASVNNGQKQGSVTGVFINQRDAQAFIDQLKTKNPQLASTVRVVPVSLGEVYKLEQTNQKKPKALDFAYVPAKQEVDAALALLQQTGQKVNSFNGTPLFVAKAGAKQKGYLTLRRNNQEVIPFFFKKQELQSMVDNFKQQQPKLASTVEIEVVNLEGVIQTLKTSNNQQLKQIELVPPRESIEFVRSLQPSTAQNQNRPAATPSKAPQSPQR